eukprot:CAMPEP_0204877390 /NCGR_PEP_ID=MMETSP1348-20121228/48163_1 /ASSEMBLY_ACC=CAM_ASM_000700 /TAXON_ID=215587 /ORGANISM="Aplanochytrium stocchinoi, Strain GSBS06" /LENGTH=834 /DNA_ID=CAMNT_0052034247 /DNA_START=194 /DNA_END=2698 /DNA_ORIENTATION=+
MATIDSPWFETNWRFAENAKDLVRMMDENFNRDLFFFSNSMLKEKEVDQISEALGRNTGLNALSLASNNFGPTSTACFASGLTMNHSVMYLSFSFNKIGDEGAKAFGEMLKCNTTLSYLSLGGNEIGDDGIVAIADGLRDNHSLACLKLYTNKISDVGASFLANALSDNDTLVYLDLNNNNVGDIGAQALLASLENNNCLCELRISNNQISNQDTAESISNLLERNHNEQKKAFIDALSSDNVAPWRRYKLMIIGEARAGKTSTVRSLLQLPYREDWESTVGADLTQIETSASQTKWMESNSEHVEFTAKFAAQHALKTLTRSKVKNSTLKSSIRRSVANRVRETQNTKGDTESSQEDFVKQFDTKLLVKARSEKDNLIFSIWDYGGQQVFYTLHHLFMTKQGVYIIVFDMLQFVCQRTNSLHRMKFWIDSVTLHAPDALLLIVGAFADKVRTQTEIRSIEVSLKELLKTRKKQAIENTIDSLCYFPLNNRTGYGIENIRGTIAQAALGHEFVKQQVPLRWVRLLDKMLETEQKEKHWISLTAVRNMAKKVGMTSYNELIFMLKRFREFGIVVHFSNTETLREVVFLDPKWLINQICKVIRDKKVHGFNEKEFEKVGLADDLRQLSENGLATRDLFEYVWGKSEIDFLIDLMRQTMLLSDWKFTGQNEYIIPSLLTDHELEEVFSGPSFFFDFSTTILPPGLFHRIVCLCSSYSGKLKSEPPQLSRTCASFWFGNRVRIQLKEEKDCIRVTLQESKNASFALFIVRSMFGKVKEEIMGENIGWVLKLQTSENEYMTFEEAKSKRKQVMPWFSKVEDTSSEQREYMENFIIASNE